MNPDPDEHVHPGHEDLQWGEGVKEKNREKKPHSRYWAISEQARKMIPGESQCKMFCGGKTCKYCTADNWTSEQMVVEGLYSEWVTDNILAMARPSDANIEKYNMIEQFQSKGVKTVVNLQQPGEHAYCGFGNQDSGFSYRPQVLMDAQFFFYNFAMEDYGVAPMSTLLDIVKVMQFAVSLGKVAVHCHAGLGRTGLIIACYLIYNNRVKAHKAIQYVRSRRPGAIQTQHQLNTCHKFEQYLKPYYIIFTSRVPEAHAISFSRFLTRQRHLLHGYEARKLKHIPKVVYVCCERLLELCGRGRALSSLRSQPIDPLPEDLVSLGGSLTRDLSPSSGSRLSVSPRLRSLSNSMRSSPTATGSSIMREAHSSSDLRATSHTKEKNKISLSLSQPLNLPNSKNYEGQRLLLPPSNSMSALSDDNNEHNANYKVMRSSPCNEDEDDDDDCIVYGENLEDRHQAETEARKAEEEEIRMVKERSDSLDSMVTRQLMSVQEVCEAVIKLDISDFQAEKLEKLEDKLNKTDEAWQDLANEEDPAVICGVMCDWLDQLIEPVLRAQDVTTLITDSTDDPQRTLLKLEKSTKHFLEYIILVISKFDPVSENCLHGVLEFFLCYLCHERLNQMYLSPRSQRPSFRDSKPENATMLFTLCVKLLKLEQRKAKESD